MRLVVVLALGAACLTADAQGVRGFGVLPGKLPLKGFGNPEGEEALRARFPEAAAAITGDDRSLATSQIRRTDANADGVVTRQEWADSGFQNPRQFFYYDLNGDGRLTVYEHSIGIARWRRRNERRADAQTSRQRIARQSRNQPEFSAALREPNPVAPEVARRREQIEKLAQYVLRVYDVNGDDVVERAEFQHDSSHLGSVAGADEDRNGRVDAGELQRWLGRRLPRVNGLASSMQSYDLDRDGQVSFQEFQAVATDNSWEAFGRWDRNRDGLITPSESHRANDLPPQYENRQPIVLKPSATAVSDIRVDDDIVIRQLRVRVRLSKENDNFVALSLLTPSGLRIPLYPGEGWQPWRGAPILDNVMFDDTAPVIRATLREPPNPRRLRPVQAATRGLTSLAGHSTRGNWRLIVHNQNARAGLLLGWSLFVTPLGSTAR